MMASAFQSTSRTSTATSISERGDVNVLDPASPRIRCLDERLNESETEDEEVKLNCVLGAQGVHDSDMNTTERSDSDGNANQEAFSDDDADDDSFCRERESTEGIVTFIAPCCVVKGVLPLVRPKATSPSTSGRWELYPHKEAHEDTGESADETDALVDNDLQNNRGITHSNRPIDPVDSAYNADCSAMNSDVEQEETSCNDADQQELDEELLSIVESLGDNIREHTEVEESGFGAGMIGVIEDRDDIVTIPNAKRVLSFSTLAMLNVDAGHSDDSPKRFKSLNHQMILPPNLSSFYLGLPAIADTPSHCKLQMRAHDPSPLISSSEDEDLDWRLRDELDQHQDDESRHNTPVPLLTPPMSPVTVEVEGGTTTVCEWPSNLAVDSALTAAINELRPLSPDSLRNLERPIEDHFDFPVVTAPSTLTPLLRGISVSK